MKGEVTDKHLLSGGRSRSRRRNSRRRSRRGGGTTGEVARIFNQNPAARTEGFRASEGSGEVDGRGEVDVSKPLILRWAGAGGGGA